MSNAMGVCLMLMLLHSGTSAGAQERKVDELPAPKPVGRIGGDGRGHQGAISSIALSPDGTRVASAGFQDGGVRVWDASTRDLLFAVRAHPSAAFSVAWFPDGSALASGGGEDSLVRIWDAKSGRLRTELNSNPGRYWSVVVAPDGKSLAGYRQDDGVYVWDLATEKIRFKVDALHHSIAYSPDSRFLATNLIPKDMERTPAIGLWKAETGELHKQLTGHTGFGPLCFSGDGTTVMAGLGKSITLWDAETGRLLRTRALSGRCSALARAPNGRWVAAGDRNGALHLWDAALEKELAAWPAHRGMVFSIAFAPKEAVLVSGGGDGEIVFWDVGPLGR